MGSELISQDCDDIDLLKRALYAALHGQEVVVGDETPGEIEFKPLDEGRILVRRKYVDPYSKDKK